MEAPRTIPELLARNVRDFGAREALVAKPYKSEVWTRRTWAELNSAADRLAAGLAGLGLAQGTRLAFLSGNCLECYETYLAAHKLGAVFLPLNARLAAREIADIVEQSRAEFLVFASEFSATVAGLRERTGLKALVCLAGEGESPPDGAVPYARLAEAAGPPPRVSLCPEDVADILFTSGTTGRPKGVVLTQANKVACGRMLGACLGISRKFYGWEKMQSAVPFFTSSGVSSVLMNWLYYGFTLILETAFDVLSALETIHRERTTHWGAVPAMIGFLLDHPRFREFDASSLRLITYGGSVMPEELIRRMQGTWPGIKVVNLYGLTEAGPGGLYLPAADALFKPGSIGIPWTPDQEARIVDPEGRDAKAGEVGEIILRGPNVMQGYDGNEAATREALWDGWLYTGDLAWHDEDGYFYYADRKKDMIIRGGYNIYPAEVENVFHEHPGVAQAAVIGIPHARLGEDLLAFVTGRGDKTPTTEELRAFCRDKLADYKIPRNVRFLDSLPLNAMGKLDKKELRKLTDRSGEDAS